MTGDFAEQRMRNEPAVEVYQAKGASEVYPGVAPNDEWADFQLKWNRMGLEMAAGSFWRSGLNTGLEVAAELGVNPFELGAVGGSDTHVTAGSYDEATYFTNRSTVPEQRTEVYRKEGEEWASEPVASGGKARHGTGGLTGIWASENTRAELFDAIRRRETFATSGTRIQVRFFGGFGLAEQIARSGATRIAASYEHGVPMGGVLGTASGAPSFLVWAMRDPGGGRLQRLQVVKGWLDDGTAQEQVVDVACADDLVPNNGRCPDNGAAVDLDDCSVSTDKGSAEIRTVCDGPGLRRYAAQLLLRARARESELPVVDLGRGAARCRAESGPAGDPPGTRRGRRRSGSIARRRPLRTDATLGRLGLEAVEFGLFDAETTTYAATVPHGVSATTVTAVAANAGASGGDRAAGRGRPDRGPPGAAGGRREPGRGHGDGRGTANRREPTPSW